jgi:hypothetical protein
MSTQPERGVLPGKRLFWPAQTGLASPRCCPVFPAVYRWLGTWLVHRHSWYIAGGPIARPERADVRRLRQPADAGPRGGWAAPTTSVVPDHGMLGRGALWIATWRRSASCDRASPSAAVRTRLFRPGRGRSRCCPVVSRRRGSSGWPAGVKGDIGLGPAAPLVDTSFEAARAVWTQAGREGLPRLVTVSYFALGRSRRGSGQHPPLHAWTGEATADMASPGRLRVGGRARGLRRLVRCHRRGRDHLQPGDRRRR